jgi:hypothetical protein
MELIVGTCFVLVAGRVGIAGDEIRLKAVETIEVAHLVGEVGDVDTEAMVGNEVFGVVGEAEKPIVFGSGGGFGIERMVVVGVDGTIAKIIDVGEQTELKPEVGIVGETGQDAECPAATDVGRVLSRQRG